MKLVSVLFLFVFGVAFFAFNISLGVFDSLFFRGDEQESLKDALKEKAVANLSVQEPEQEIFSPEPLKILPDRESSSGSLSKAGIFMWTNTHRQAAHVFELERRSLLDEVAERKVQDMFARQYFAHVSPTGEGIGQLAQEEGYEFISIGENLALGDFASDQALVQAWMDSPGHRANILNSRFQEIGIAAQKGMFEGNSTWLAVQVFALPLAACDSPAEQLKEKIESGTMQVDELALTLEQMRAELQGYRFKAGPAYSRKAKEYNALVDQYNSLIGRVQADIKKYNLQVQTFNACAQQ